MWTILLHLVPGSCCCSVGLADVFVGWFDQSLWDQSKRSHSRLSAQLSVTFFEKRTDGWRCWVTFFNDNKDGGGVKNGRMTVRFYRKVLRIEVWWLKSFIEICWWNYFWNPFLSPLDWWVRSNFQIVESSDRCSRQDCGARSSSVMIEMFCMLGLKQDETSNNLKIIRSLFPQDHFSASCWIGVVFSHLWEKTSWNFH